MTQNLAPRSLGETYVLKGKIPGDYSQHRIMLFDGRFDTAWRVTQFIIAPERILDSSHLAQLLLVYSQVQHHQMQTLLI